MKGMEIDKSNEISAQSTAREKENNAALSNRYPKNAPVNTSREGLMKTVVIKSVKTSQEPYKRASYKEKEYGEAEMAEETPKGGEIVVQEKSEREWDVEGSSSNNISVWEQQGKPEDRVKQSSRERMAKIETGKQEDAKFEFTLGSFRPERKPQQAMDNIQEIPEEGYKKSSQSNRTVLKDSSMEVSSREQKTR